MKLKISDNIRKFRKSLNLTQEELAERLGTSYQTISRWENGTTYPDIEMLPAIADLFHISIENLMGVSKEERTEMSEECYQKLNRTVDPKKRLSLLREMHHEFPRDATIIHNLCHEADNLDEQRKMTQLLIQINEDSSDDYSIYVTQAIGCLINTEDEDKLESLLMKHTSEISLSRELRLEDRYLHRKEYDKYEIRKQENLRIALFDLVFNKLVKDYPPKSDINNSIWASRTRLAMLDLFTGTTGKNPVSGDGVPDLWYGERLKAGMRYACHLASIGEEEKALCALEDLTDLYEKFWSLPNSTVLTFRCPALDRIKCTVQHTLLPQPKVSENYGDEKYNARIISSKTKKCNHRELHWSCWDYTPLVAKSGWEWFDPIRNNPRYTACVERMKAFEKDEIYPDCK